MIIRVTEKNIEQGDVSFEGCPVARALVDAGMRAPWVSSRCLQWTTPAGVRRNMVPEPHIYDWIKRFDLRFGGQILPMETTQFNIPDENDQ